MTEHTIPAALDSDAALFARQRDDAQAIVLAVARILGISHLKDGLEHGRITDAVRYQMDAERRLTQERDSALADAARLAEALADVQESRLAWAIEADRLDVEVERLTAELEAPPAAGDLRQRCISALSEQVSEFISPNEFGGYDPHYGELVDIVLAEVRPEVARLTREVGREKQCYRTASEGREHAWGELERISQLMGVDEDDFAVEAVGGEVERYIDQVKLVTDRLTRERDEAREHLDLVRRALRTPDGWATKMHALRVRQQRDEAQAQLASRPAFPADAEEGIRTGIGAWLDTENLRELSKADIARGAAGAAMGVIEGWLPPVSGSDTAEDAEEQQR